MESGRAVVRAYSSSDRPAVVEMLAEMGWRYPGFGDWLARRLDEVEAGRAWALVAGEGEDVSGLVILTPKGQGVLKLSTLYVRQGLQEQGLGSLLLNAAKSKWLELGVHRVYGTMNEEIWERSKRWHEEHGFSEVAAVEGRYGAGKTEVVVEWVG